MTEIGATKRAVPQVIDRAARRAKTDRLRSTAEGSARQIALITSGVFLVVIALVLEAVSMTQHLTTTVTKFGESTTTTTNGAAPTPALVAAVFVSGVVLILTGAFFNRITKIVLPGGAALDLKDQAAITGKLVKNAGGDETKAKQRFAQVVGHLAVADSDPNTNRFAGPVDRDQLIQKLVDGAIAEVP